MSERELFSSEMLYLRQFYSYHKCYYFMKHTQSGRNVVESCYLLCMIYTCRNVLFAVYDIYSVVIIM